MLSTIKRNSCLSASSYTHTSSLYYYSTSSHSLLSKRIIIVFVISTLLMCDAVLCQHPHKRQPRHGKSLCHHKKSGYFANPRDPNSYVHCINGNSYVYFCGKGTVFVSEKEMCAPPTVTEPHHSGNNRNLIGDEAINAKHLRFHKKRYNVILV